MLIWYIFWAAAIFVGVPSLAFIITKMIFSAYFLAKRQFETDNKTKDQEK